MPRSPIRVLVLVRPYLLGSALAHALTNAERDVLAVDIDNDEIPAGAFTVIVTTEQIPRVVEAEAIIELPPANSRSFGAIHHGRTTRLLAFDDPDAVGEALTNLAAAS